MVCARRQMSSMTGRSSVLTALRACRYSYDLKGIPLSYNSLTVSSVQVCSA